MKRKLLYFTTLLLASISGKSQQFFSQDFNSPATIESITSSTPNSNQFSDAGSDGSGNVAITDEKLYLTRGTSGYSYCVRTGLAPQTQFIKVSFKLTITNDQTSTSSAPSATFAFGDGFINDGSLEDNTKTWARIGTLLAGNTTDLLNYRWRDDGVASNSTVIYSKTTETTITLYLNATNASQDYTAPDGTSTYTLPAQQWNLYVGNDLQFSQPNRNAVTSTAVINSFKFRHNVHVGDWIVDDLVMESLPAVLPVSLTSFTGKWENGTTKLYWETASEQNNSHFEVLRSVSGNDFIKIGTIEGNGTSSNTHNYVYLDDRSLEGLNYYRLRQVDFNGNSREYDAIAVSNPLQSKRLSAFVTSSGDLSISLNAVSGRAAAIRVTNTQGKTAAELKANLQAGENHLLLPFGQAPAGVYIIVLDGAPAHKILKN